MKNIYPIRNSIAHNRYLPNINIDSINSSLSYVLNVINDIYIYNVENISCNFFEKRVNIISSITDKVIHLLNNKFIIKQNINKFISFNRKKDDR